MRTICQIAIFSLLFEHGYAFPVKGKGIVGIDRNENILFKVYIFDNGPDYPSDGLFRIVKNGKIGYANLKGQTVITPKYDCAYPFKKGKAEVGIGCQTKSAGEYHYWVGDHWYTINKRGQVVKNNDRRLHKWKLYI